MSQRQFFSPHSQFTIHEENRETATRLGIVYQAAAWTILVVVGLFIYFTGFATVVPLLWNWHGLYYLSYLIWTALFIILAACAVMMLVRYQLTHMHITIVERHIQPEEEELPPLPSVEQEPEEEEEGYIPQQEQSPVIIVDATPLK